MDEEPAAELEALVSQDVDLGPVIRHAVISSTAVIVDLDAPDDDHAGKQWAHVEAEMIEPPGDKAEELLRVLPRATGLKVLPIVSEQVPQSGQVLRIRKRKDLLLPREASQVRRAIRVGRETKDVVEPLKPAEERAK